MGTSHRGSGIASWREMASNLARVTLQDSHKKIIETLKVDNEVLDNSHEQFVELAFQHIHSFQEGRGMFGVKGLHEKVRCPREHAITDITDPQEHTQVVSDFSSKLGLPKIETVESIDANHMQMARCEDRSSESYRFVAAVLKRFLKDANMNVDLPLRPVTQMQREAASSTEHQVDAR